MTDEEKMETIEKLKTENERLKAEIQNQTIRDVQKAQQEQQTQSDNLSALKEQIFYDDLKLDEASKEKRKKLGEFGRKFFGALLLGIVSIVVLNLYFGDIKNRNSYTSQTSSIDNFLHLALYAVFAAVLLALIADVLMKWMEERKMREVRNETQSKIDKLIPLLKPEESYFIDLANVNIKNLREYYQMVKSQTEKSFYLAAITGLIGFVLIIWGIAIGMNQFNSTVGATLQGSSQSNFGYISTASGIITEFIAGVFFYLYNKTVLQLKEYHDRLINVQNVLLAYKLIGGVNSGDSDKKNEMDKMMVEGLLKDR